MKYVKLFFISVIVFGVMLFCISLLFPSITIVSRAVNVKGEKESLKYKFPDLYETAFRDSTIQKRTQLFIDSIKRTPAFAESEFISSAYKAEYGDTLLFTSPFAAHIQQGVAIYDLHNDSTAVQVFYKIHVPTYKFWDKFGLMLNEAKYGPSLDSAIKRIERRF